MSRLGVSLLLVCVFCSRVQAEDEPPKVVPPEVQVGGDFSPPPPPPAFPSFPQIGGNGGGGQDGGGGEPVPPVIYTPPPPPPPQVVVEEFKIKEKKPEVVEPPHRRHPLFITSVEKVYRSNVFFRERQENRDAIGAIDEATLSLETALRESQNDVLAAKHEYESDLLKVETTKQVHEMNEKLYAKKVLPRQSYEESLAKMKKITFRVDEARARWKEFEAEVVINKWKLSQAKGGTVPLIDKAKSYVALWEARLDKVRAAEGQAKAEYDYWTSVYDMHSRLYQANATSREELINIQKELEEAGVVWKLAKTLIENNSRFVDEARASVKLVEKGETVPL